jgi:hypothetical protein
MPLLDHFHPPLGKQRHWESFHARWAAALADALNAGLLPPGYFAEIQVTLGGGRIEVDVPTLEESGNGVAAASASASQQGGMATLAVPAWAPPAPTLDMAATFPDEVEVLVFSSEGGPTLVGAIELVSPRNNDRPDARRAFAVKCLAYLQQGIGLVMVDVVTTRRANLHDEMVELMPQAGSFPDNAALYAAAYRPYRRQDAERIAVWPAALAIGQELPAMPLWVRGLTAPVRVDLEATYTEARQRLQLG